jgi:hypothetical protein
MPQPAGYQRLENTARNAVSRLRPEPRPLDATLVASATIAAAPPVVPPAQPAGETVVARPKPTAQPVAAPIKKRSPLLVVAIILGVLFVIGAILGGGTYLLGQQGIGPLAVAAASSPTATLPPRPTTTQQAVRLPLIVVENTPTLKATDRHLPTIAASTRLPPYQHTYCPT